MEKMKKLMARLVTMNWDSITLFANVAHIAAGGKMATIRFDKGNYVAQFKHLYLSSANLDEIISEIEAKLEIHEQITIGFCEDCEEVWQTEAYFEREKTHNEGYD